MNPGTRFDDAVVGAGILGLAHAYHLARRGRNVVVFERRARAEAALVPDLGTLWPIGQPTGPLRRMALRSREVWLEVLGVSGLGHERTGSLHLAYRDDEAAVLREFADRASGEGFRCEMLGPEDVLKRSPVVRPGGLLAGLHSHWEVCLDPGEVLAGLPVWLAGERGVHFEFGRRVVGFEAPGVRTRDGDWSAERLWVCDDDELGMLYPEAADRLGLLPGLLRVLRMAPPPDGFRAGPILAGGATLGLCPAFRDCPGLPVLRARVARESPELDRHGIDALTAHDARGGLTIGATHRDSDPGPPRHADEIDRILLQHASTFLDAVPEVRSRRWQSQAANPEAPYCLVRPEPLVAAVAGIGGAGMTLSFGLAEVVVNHVLGGD